MRLTCDVFAVASRGFVFAVVRHDGGWQWRISTEFGGVLV